MDSMIKTVNIMVNNECNLRCPHCDLPATYNKYNKDLSAEAWGKLLDNLLPRIKPNVLAVASREPLLPGSQEKTAAIMKAGERQKINSKGFVTNGYFAREFWQKYPDLRVNYMDISVDGPAEINQRTRGPKHFHIVERFIKSRIYQDNIEKVFISTALTKWTAPKEILSNFLNWIIGSQEEPRLVLLVLYPNENVNKELYIEDTDFLKIIDLLVKESRNFEDLFLDMFPSSLPGLSKMMEKGILPKGKDFVRDNSGMLYGHIDGNLYIRIENRIGLQKYHLRISPEGHVLPVHSIAKQDYLSGSCGSLIEETWDVIQDRTISGLHEKLPVKCIGKTCARVCGGENYRCPILA